MPVCRIKAKPVSAQAFEKYGQVITIPDNEENTVCEDRYTFWPGIAEFDCPNGKLKIGISRLFLRPYRTCVMERQLGTQAMMLTMTGPILIIVCKNEGMNKDEIVNYKNAEAFILEQGQGVIINKGVWHWTANPIGSDQDVLFCTQSAGVDDGVVKQMFPRGETLEVIME